MKLLSALVALTAGSSALAGAQAPDRHVGVAIGGGLLAADHSPGGAGINLFVRVGWPRLPLVVDASFENTPGQVLVAVLCKPGAINCGGFSNYSGEITALTFAPAIQFTERGRKAALLYRVGPSVHWLTDRQPGSASAAGGYRAGLSLRLGEGNSGFLISADYYRLLRGNTAPRWFLPITIGWQF